MSIKIRKETPVKHKRHKTQKTHLISKTEINVHKGIKPLFPQIMIKTYGSKMKEFRRSN